MDWSFQLYSARNFQPWPQVLQTLARLGYRNVEGFGGLYDDPARLKAELDANGLAMPSGHFSLELLEDDFRRARDIAETLGVQLVACPYLAADARPSDAAGWKRFGERLGEVGKKVSDAGLRLWLAQPRFRVQAARRTARCRRTISSQPRPSLAGRWTSPG